METRMRYSREIEGPKACKVCGQPTANASNTVCPKVECKTEAASLAGRRTDYERDLTDAEINAILEQGDRRAWNLDETHARRRGFAALHLPTPQIDRSGYPV